MVKTKSTLFLMVFFALLYANAMTDKQTMLAARTAYAENKLTEALDLYTKISPQSDFWLEAIEERAWAHTKMQKYENALADLQSITSPVWSSQIGPESYMLSSFVSLKLCNYKEVALKIDLFKKRMLPRVDALEKLVSSPLTSDLTQMFSQIKQQKISLSSLGKDAEKYPRYFFRDQDLLSAIEKNQTPLAANRIRAMAQADLNEIQLNLKKMKIIEVELMQNILVADRPQTSSKKLTFTDVDHNKKMIFPVTDDEVWVDEVGQFQVRTQNCQYQKGSRL